MEKKPANKELVVNRIIELLDRAKNKSYDSTFSTDRENFIEAAWLDVEIAKQWIKLYKIML